MTTANSHGPANRRDKPLDTWLADAIHKIGPALNPDTEQASVALFAPLHPPVSPGVRCERDLRYGPLERQRMNVFHAQDAQSCPVMLFIHGGGFVAGDKSLPGLPFYDNVGAWAVRCGFVGVVMNYRLAPQDPWPAGPEDVGRAVAWLRSQIGAYGGDPKRIFLFAQSAGAAHAASYLAHPRFHTEGNAGLKGAILVSGLYDIAGMERNPMIDSYYGSDPSLYAERSSVPAIGNSDVPVLVAVGDVELAEFDRQAMLLMNALFACRHRIPDFVRMTGHSHFSQIFALGLDFHTELSDAVVRFVATV